MMVVLPQEPPPPAPPAAATQAPAVAAGVDALAQHAHAAQPGASSAEAAQQQPPAQRLVPQSAAEAQASPGENSAHAPVPAAQAAHPARKAFGEQQKPPRPAPEKQDALSDTAQPSGSAQAAEPGALSGACAGHAVGPEEQRGQKVFAGQVALVPAPGGQKDPAAQSGAAESLRSNDA